MRSHNHIKQAWGSHCHDGTMHSLPSTRKTPIRTCSLLLSLLLLNYARLSSVSAFLPSHYQTYPTPSKPPSLYHTTSSSFTSTTTTSLQASPTMSFTLSSSSFYLSRIVFLRALALVYSVAFLVAYNQNQGLIGDAGITPARRVLDSAEARGRKTRREREEWLQEFHHAIPAWKRVLYNNTTYQYLRERLWDRADRLQRPVMTLLWLCKDRSHLNSWLNNIALVGLCSSLAILITGAANVPLLLVCWMCQRSLMAVGGPWYGYGWEPQLGELGFHALFLVPLLSMNPLHSAPPIFIIWSIRWYLFKIMMGAVSFATMPCTLALALVYSFTFPFPSYRV